MIFNKQQTFWMVTAFVLGFSSCSGNEQTEAQSSHDRLLMNQDTIPQTGDALRGSDSGIVVMETKRPQITLLGRWQQLPNSEIREAIKSQANQIVAEIVSRKFTLNGGLTLVYRKFPATGTQEVFIGIPVGLKTSESEELSKKNSGEGNPNASQFYTITLPSSTFLKATVNAEPGLTNSSWLRFKTLMLNRKQLGEGDFVSKENPNAKIGEIDLNRCASTFPYIEYYTDSRNLEMTTTVSQAILLMRKP